MHSKYFLVWVYLIVTLLFVGITLYIGYEYGRLLVYEIAVILLLAYLTIILFICVVYACLISHDKEGD